MYPPPSRKDNIFERIMAQTPYLVKCAKEAKEPVKKPANVQFVRSGNAVCLLAPSPLPPPPDLDQ